MPPRVWVITGSSSGLGLATALHALRQGDKVVATVRSLSKVPDALRAAGARPLILNLDDPDEHIQQAAKQAITVYGYVDVLVNNAGTSINGYGPIEELSVQDMRKHFQTSLFGTLAFTQPFIAHFRTRRTEDIINVSSLAAGLSTPAWGPYCASKLALESFSETLSKELTLFNVRVTIIIAGYFPTNIFRTHPAYVEDGRVSGSPEATRSTVYIDPETQGYDSMNWLPRRSEARGLVGDPEKFAERVFEIVARKGLAYEVTRGAPVGWVKVACGSDAGSRILKQLEDTAENFKAFEPVWRSTDVRTEQKPVSSRL
ncbi:uncharacterized protein PHACADRAFT_91165 [Phanerochaete carnosa HHB-10118-sp]|uniref:NAD(P)-binding protein n=1 Tax=Phanerochaete carnosa (strain HHB-10118-sp) TaxID=650164 RepID=K5V3G7_PHACS|nr:uncharacterized protein PHACADRAFT_91165 [Phanerochaete carnosa HHB-10118-sp]EKM57121.1 hypothetical protein PHACADRAFT_91165 [Phanerochaete carnosa HHB-10118-sp]